MALGCLSLLGLSIGANSAAATTQTFTYTGSEQVFTVPAGVSTIHVLAVGGHGGKGGEVGGLAAEVQGDLTVKPGQVLYVEVGGNGGGSGGPLSPGGFNGGGEGAGGGGGASDVRTNPRSEGLSPDTRLIVAAGGGGGGSFGSLGAGAGGNAEEAGGSIPVNEGGGPGTAFGSGSGGSGGCVPGLTGELGLGGAGANCEESALGGGGGGGGYYGGGGGGAGVSNGGGGGGGGSSLTPAGGKSTLSSSPPEVQITYAGSSAAKPEVGRCVATRGGIYQNSACTTKATGSGKYEWQPWPFTKAGFALTNGTATLKTAVNKTTISCAENTITGEYTGLQSATLGIAFSECKVLGPFGGQCTGEKAAPGEIVSSPLEAEFGLIDGFTSPPSVGWWIHPVSGEEFLSFQCGGTNVSVTGSVIATMTPVNKMSGSFKLNFSGSGGVQKPESFEGGEKRFLTLETAFATEQVGLTMNDSIANERLLEIRATS